jgi:hypothetical protein
MEQHLPDRQELPYQCRNHRDLLRIAHQDSLDAAAINVRKEKPTKMNYELRAER